MKRTILSLAVVGSLMIAATACNSTRNASETRDSTTMDSTINSSATDTTSTMDTTAKAVDTTRTTMPPDTTTKPKM